IHAPREGSDQLVIGDGQHLHPISIHAPREGSDLVTVCRNLIQSRRFLSTLPARGATCHSGRKISAPRISIHAPREGSDHTLICFCCLLYRHFYPRSPRGERRTKWMASTISA